MLSKRARSAGLSCHHRPVLEYTYTDTETKRFDDECASANVSAERTPSLSFFRRRWGGGSHSASRRLCGQLLRKNIPVSQESRNFSGLFRMPPIPLYIRNAEVLSHQILPSSCFSYIKSVLKDQLFKTSGLQFGNWLFGPERFSEPSKNRPQITQRTQVVDQERVQCAIMNL